MAIGRLFDLDLVGGIFEDIAHVLPFHAVEVGKAALNGNYGDMIPHVWWVIGYAVVIVVVSIAVFKKKTHNV